MKLDVTLTDDQVKWLRDKFHVSVRLHRHEQERFGKKWKRDRERLKAGPSAQLQAKGPEL